MVSRTAVVFETHSVSVDNEAGIASGWNHSELSAAGRALAKELGECRKRACRGLRDQIRQMCASTSQNTAARMTVPSSATRLSRVG